MDDRKELSTYSKLDADRHEIRLVHLQPREAGHEVKCRITTTSLDREPEYEALSYEWGPPDSKQMSIIIDHVQVSIRENLGLALDHLRNQTTPRTLWIDALCINQNDVEERNHQVAQMRRIYSNAFRVVAWIGLEYTYDTEHLSGEVRAAIGLLASLSVSSIDSIPYYESSLLFSKKYLENQDVDVEDAVWWTASRLLCLRKYWARLWIIQELVLAKEIHIQCGALKIPWQSFSQVCSRMRGQEDLSNPRQPRHNLAHSTAFVLDSIRHLESKKAPSGMKSSRSHLLVDVLAQFKNSDCDDPRDKVYGILSLCKPCCQDAVPIDYSFSANAITLALKVLVHDLTEHERDATETVAICRRVLNALRPKLLHEPAGPNLSLKQIRFRAGDIKIPVRTKYCGHIVWLSHKPLDIMNGRWFPTDLILGDRNAKPFEDADSVIYFNLSSEYPRDNLPLLKDRSHSRGGISDPSGRLIDAKPTKWFQSLLPPRRRAPIPTIPDIHITLEDELNKEDEHVLPVSQPIFSPNPVTRAMPFPDNLKQLWKISSLQFFRTSIGTFRLTTGNVELGNRVFKLDGEDGRLAVCSIKGDMCSLVGKGLAMQPREDIPESNTGVKIDEDYMCDLDMEVDMATLFYLAGYF